MRGFQWFSTSTVLFSGVLVGAVLLSGCTSFQPSEPVASPELLTPGGESKTATVGPVTISQVISNNGQPVGLRLNDRQSLRFSTPGAKLYTDGLAFSSAVSEGLGGFLITPNAPAWSDSCEPAGTLPEGLSVQQPELFTPHWRACLLGRQWVVLSMVEIGVQGDTTDIWLGVPVHPTWESELQRVEWSLEVIDR